MSISSFENDRNEVILFQNQFIITKQSQLIPKNLLTACLLLYTLIIIIIVKEKMYKLTQYLRFFFFMGNIDRKYTNSP